MEKYNFNVTGQDKKLLVTAISGIFEIKPRYTGVPKCSHIIGPATVTRNGYVEIDGTDEEARSLIRKLAEMGFTAEGNPHLMRDETEEADVDNTAVSVDESVDEDGTTEMHVADGLQGEDENTRSAQGRDSAGTTISVPRNLFSDLAIGNLKKVLKAKGALLRRALGVEDVDIEVTDEAINFPWFGELTPDETRIFSQFIEKLCKFAITSKRIQRTRPKATS